MTARFGFRRHRDLIAAGAALRVLNYHTTPASRAGRLRSELAELQRRCDLLDLAGLGELFDGRTRTRTRTPGLAVLLRGYADHHDVAAQVCAELDITAWFAVCTGFVDCPPAEQEAFARSHWIALTDEQLATDRLAMTWPQVAELARDHVVFPHTATHDGIAETVTDADLEREVHAPKRAMDAATGQDSAAFAWLGGSPWGTSPRHDAAVRDAGYRYVVSNTMVQRLA